jgi:hypothetical protein
MRLQCSAERKRTMCRLVRCKSRPNKMETTRIPLCFRGGVIYVCICGEVNGSSEVGGGQDGTLGRWTPRVWIGFAWQIANISGVWTRGAICR